MTLDEDAANPASYWNQLAESKAAGTAVTCRCGEENPGHYDTCHFCQHPCGSPEMPALDENTVSGTFHGVHVIDDESGAIAATHDRQKAAAALRAYYRFTNGASLPAEEFDFADLTRGWGWFEERADGPWHFCSVDRPDRPDVFPALWLCI